MDGCAEAVCPEGGLHALCNNGGEVFLTQVFCSRQGVTTSSLNTFILKWRIYHFDTHTYSAYCKLSIGLVVNRTSFQTDLNLKGVAWDGGKVWETLEKNKGKWWKKYNKFISYW